MIFYLLLIETNVQLQFDLNTPEVIQLRKCDLSTKKEHY